MGMDFIIRATAGDGKSLIIKEARRHEATPILHWLGVTDNDIYNNTYMEGEFTPEQLAKLEEAFHSDDSELPWKVDWSVYIGLEPGDDEFLDRQMWYTIDLIVKCSKLDWPIKWDFYQ